MPTGTVAFTIGDTSVCTAAMTRNPAVKGGPARRRTHRSERTRPWSLSSLGDSVYEPSTETTTLSVAHSSSGGAGHTHTNHRGRPPRPEPPVVTTERRCERAQSPPLPGRCWVVQWRPVVARAHSFELRGRSIEVAVVGAASVGSQGVVGVASIVPIAAIQQSARPVTPTGAGNRMTSSAHPLTETSPATSDVPWSLDSRRLDQRWAVVSQAKTKGAPSCQIDPSTTRRDGRCQGTGQFQA